METIDLTISSLLLVFLLLIIPLAIGYYLKLKINTSLLNSVVRMTIQLLLIAVFLKYLFQWNNLIINLTWLFIMILVAVFSAIRSSAMKAKKIIIPVFISFATATLSVIFYLNIFVIRIDYIFDARYLIVLGGMLLGNSLRGNIVGIDHFYSSIRKDKKRFLYILSLGAGLDEAVLPYLRNSIRLALKPTLASMATIGIVALPGMMTGVILGGADPGLAVRYQLMIMISIVVSTFVSVLMTILMTVGTCFNNYGVLKEEVFIKDIK